MRRVFNVILFLLLLKPWPGEVQAELLGYWPLDGDANDISGNSYNGTIYGPNVFTEGKDGVPGTAMTFNGTSNYIDLSSHVAAFSNMSNFTVSAWIKGYQGGAGNCVLSLSNGNITEKLQLELHLDQIVHGYKTPTTNWKGLYSAAQVWPEDPNEWDHIAWVNDNGIRRIYHNGFEVASDALGIGTVSLDNLAYMTIGAIEYDSSIINLGSFSLDEVRIYNNALTQEEILVLAQDVPPLNKTDISLMWSGVSVAAVWVPDLGNGQYRNPIIHADYSDPDVVRVGDEFFMTASSFNCVPALPILHSTDLVNWTLVNHAVKRLPPFDFFDKPQHGNGVWAPAIRYHEGWFYIFWGDPDFGIYMVKSKDPLGEWEPPHLVQAARGWIDPCPFWDDDGKAYLVHAFAKSRAGFNSIVTLHGMAPDGSKLLDEGVTVFDGRGNHPTIEGTKMHKQNGFYYILAPAGGVAEGWQTVLRSKNIYGPYEDKVVLHQGDTDVNGPHQGAWVELENGDDWFIHFQERQPYGRIVHLQPARWENNWLMIGEDSNGDGVGEPVATWKKPDVDGPYAVQVPQTSDEFSTTELGLQWQWHANPQPGWFSLVEMGCLRMHPVALPQGIKNLWGAPSLLLQKMPAEEFTATAKVKFESHQDGERTGLIIMGRDYASLVLEQENGQLVVKQIICHDAENGAPEKVVASVPVDRNELYLRVHVAAGGVCRFSYSADGDAFAVIGNEFKAREGKWIGSKVGMFCVCDAHHGDAGCAGYDWFRIE